MCCAPMGHQGERPDLEVARREILDVEPAFAPRDDVEHQTVGQSWQRQAPGAVNSDRQ